MLDCFRPSQIALLCICGFAKCPQTPAGWDFHPKIEESPPATKLTGIPAARSRIEIKTLTTIMTQSREPNDRDIFTRLAALEYQVTEIQNTQAQLRATIVPGSYVTDAFERVVDRIDEVEERLNTRMDSMDGKLDAILRSITGLGNS